MDKTLYVTIGVTPTATLEEIEAACLTIGGQLVPHLDSDPDAAQFFNEIERAFEILTNDEKRKEYDLDLELKMSLDKALSAD